MKFNKYIITASALTLVVGALLIGTQSNLNSTNFSKEEIISSYENVINYDGIEHIKIILSGGESIETYRDSAEGKEQMDHYDEFGNLITRNITKNFGQEMVSISNIGTPENPNYIGLNTLVSKSIYAENKELISQPLIESTLMENDFDLYSLNWENVKSNDQQLLKFTSENYNIYINTSTDSLVKFEILADNEVLTTVEFEKIDRDSLIAGGLFSIESPFSSEVASETVNVDEIEFNTEDNTNVEYPASTANANG